MHRVFMLYLVLSEAIRVFLIEFDVFLLTMAMFALGVETNFEKSRGLGLKPVLLAGIMFAWLVIGGIIVKIHRLTFQNDMPALP